MDLQTTKLPLPSSKVVLVFDMHVHTLWHKQPRNCCKRACYFTFTFNFKRTGNWQLNFIRNSLDICRLFSIPVEESSPGLTLKSSCMEREPICVHCVTDFEA